MTKVLACSNKIYNYRFEIFSQQTHCVICALYLQFEVINLWTRDTLKNSLAYNHKRVNYNLDFFTLRAQGVIYSLCLQLYLLKWWSSETLTNTLAYNHKIFHYNPKTYYYTGVMCNYWNDEQVKHWHTR